MSVTTTTTPITEAPKPTTVTIDTSFKIICSASASNAEKAAANQIVTAMSHFGIKLSIQNDTAPQSGNEILIGNTSRAQSQSALKELSAGGYSLTLSENEANGVSLILAAIDADGLELATKHLILNYLSLDKKATLPFTLSITHTKANVTLQEKYQLSDYTIVYAKEGIMSDVNIQSAKYAEAARDFANLVEKFTGHTLTVVSDTADLSKYQHLILFGNTSSLDDNIVYSGAFFKKGAKAYSVRMFDNGNISLAGNNPVSAYAAAKGGLKMLTKNIASEYGGLNIQCNGIGPGYIATPQTAPLRQQGVPFNEFIISKTPAGRWGETSDLVGPAIFLASDASNFVNGHILYVDGGILAYIGKQPS